MTTIEKKDMTTTEKKTVWRYLLIINATLGVIAVVLLILLYLDRPHIGYIDEDRIVKKYSHIGERDAVEEKKLTGEQKKDGVKMYDPVPAMTAQDGIDAFRDEQNYGSYFVTYDTMVIKDYISIASAQIKDFVAHGGIVLGPDSDSCWQIGFSPYIRDVGIGSAHDLKLDFLATPVIVPKRSTSTNYRDWGKQGGGIDYFLKFGNPYNKTYIKPYDLGNMHP